MMQPINWCLAVALALLVTFMAGRSSGIDPQAAAEAEKAYQATQPEKTMTGRRINLTQLALLKAADAQYGLMAEALAIFSDDGTKPLFDRSIDPGIKDKKKGLANYGRLIVAIDRVAAAEPGFHQAMKKISAETGIERPGTPHSCQLLPSGPTRLFALWPPALACLLQTDSVLAGWDFWNIPARRRASDRETIRQVTLVDSGKLGPQKRKRLVERVYRQVQEVVKVNVNNEADKTRLSTLMTSQKEFYANLLDGKLDELAPHLHLQMCGDAEGGGEDYLKLADDRGETPGKILVRTGADAVNSGVKVYVAVTKDALGTQLGEQVGTGIDAANTTWEKIEQAEKGLPELKKNVVKDAKEVIRKRAIEFLSEKLGVPADALDKPTEDIGESVQDFGQNVEFDRRVAEAGKAGFQDIIEHDLKEGVNSLEVIRQATDKVSGQIREEGWGRGVVQVGSRQDGRSLDGAVVWYEDAHTQSTKLLIHPLPVVPGEKLSLPDGAKVELIEMSDSGEIRRVTDGPVLVSAEGVAMIDVKRPDETPPPETVTDDTPIPTPPEPVPGNPDVKSPGAQVSEKLKKRAKELAEKGWKPPEKTEIAEAKAVIPQDCTIEILVWDPDNAVGRRAMVLLVRGGKVTGNWPDVLIVAADNKENFTSDERRWTGGFEGTLQDNTITGTSKESWGPAHTKIYERGRLTSHTVDSAVNTGPCSFELLANGTLVWRSTAMTTSRMRWLVGKSPEGKTELITQGNLERDSATSGHPGCGVWQLRK